jgi:hypothetical protein
VVRDGSSLSKSDSSSVKRYASSSRSRRLQDSLDSDMGVLGDEVCRWERDDNSCENLGWDDVALGVDELGVGEFGREEFQGWDLDGWDGWDWEDKGWDPDA